MSGGEMREPGRRSGPSALLSLAENLESAPVRSSWIDRLVVLGSRLARKARDFGDRQLIVAISVPGREYAAALIGTGWTVCRPPRQTAADPLILLQGAPLQATYRAVEAEHVISGPYQGLSETLVRKEKLPVVRLAGRQYVVNRLEAAAPVGERDLAERMPRPRIGSIGRMTGIDLDWAWRLVAPAADLAIVGTKSWINEDLEAVLARGEDGDGDLLETLLLPRTGRSATWFTRIYSASGFADQPPLPDDVVLAILDGQGAIRYINDLLTPIVVCVFDRSVADESAAEQVVQLRNSRGEPISLAAELGWTPPAGVEALAFTVAL